MSARHWSRLASFTTPLPSPPWRKFALGLALDVAVVFGSWILFGAIGYGLWRGAIAMGWIKP